MRIRFILCSRSLFGSNLLPLVFVKLDEVIDIHFETFWELFTSWKLSLWNAERTQFHKLTFIRRRFFSGNNIAVCSAIAVGNISNLPSRHSYTKLSRLSDFYGFSHPDDCYIQLNLPPLQSPDSIIIHTMLSSSSFLAPKRKHSQFFRREICIVLRASTLESQVMNDAVRWANWNLKNRIKREEISPRVLLFIAFLQDFVYVYPRKLGEKASWREKYHFSSQRRWMRAKFSFAYQFNSGTGWRKQQEEHESLKTDRNSSFLSVRMDQQIKHRSKQKKDDATIFFHYLIDVEGKIAFWFRSCVLGMLTREFSSARTFSYLASVEANCCSRADAHGGRKKLINLLVEIFALLGCFSHRSIVDSVGKHRE